jgi:hypothetical protein
MFRIKQFILLELLESEYGGITMLRKVGNHLENNTAVSLSPPVYSSAGIRTAKSGTKRAARTSPVSVCVLSIKQLAGVAIYYEC